MRRWSKTDKKRLKELWQKAKKSRDKFKELILQDTLLKEKGWPACEQFSRRNGLYDSAKPAKRYIFNNLDPKDLDDLKKLLSDNNIPWETISGDVRFSNFDGNQLRCFATRCGIKIKKEKSGPKNDSNGGGEMTQNPSQPLTEQQLIEKREAGELPVQDFLKGLSEVKSEFSGYWNVINETLQKQRVLRVKDLLPFAEQLNAKQEKEKYRLNFIAGILRKFDQWQTLISFQGDKKKGDRHTYYLSDLPDFYKPEELYKLVPESEQQRIAAHISVEPSQISTIAKLLYGDEERGNAFLKTFLAYYEALSLVKYNKKEDTYCLTQRGLELGVDAQSIKTLEATALENALFVEQEEGGRLPKSLDEVGDALERDITKKTVPITDLTKELKEGDLKLLFLGEIMYGSQYTDQKLLDWILGTASPGLIITSGLVQGRFEVRNKAKTKMLSEEGGLHKIENQFHAAGMLLEWMEKVATNKVCVIQGDDDFRMAEDYGTLMHLAEGKNPWKFGVDWSSFSAEMKRRLENKELRRKIRIQWETIQTYMYRIGRSLLNRREVAAKIGVAKSEYRLIMEIMVAKKNNFDYPKEYEKVVDVSALYENMGKRIVTPDPLRLLVAPGKEIRIVHNAGFSDITQYQETLAHLDAIARHLGLSRKELPAIIADFHQEAFSMEYIQGTIIMNLPGMQNTLPASAYTMQEWHTRILEAKERRQSRVRKEPPSPSAPEFTFCKDGRIRVRILNNNIKKIIEEQKDQPEKKSVGILATDLQFGSITNYPEYTTKFLDYGLYERRAEHLWLNGDIIHGGIYPQFNSENRPMRLTTLHSQQKFAFDLMMPLIISAPNLVDVAAWLGNHEWNNMGAKYQGDSPLTFLETGLQGVLMERERLGVESTLKRAMNVSRIRWKDTHNPQADIVNWPFYSDTICGFKVAIQHMWQPFHGKNPTNDFKKWLKNMAQNAKSIDILLGGHLHCVWMSQLGDKIIVQAGAGASESGYDLHFGLFSTVMYTLVEFSNKEGITVEFVPWQFLEKYKFQSLKYKDKDELFVRPNTPGTKEYEQGKMAPYIEEMIDNLTGHLSV